MNPGGRTSVARRAATTAMATKSTSSTNVTRASRLVSSTATATIGPNSPIEPTDRIEGPILVWRTPESRRIGRSVPRAVVVRQSATTTESSTSPVPCNTAPTPSAMSTEAPHDPAARPRCPCRITDRSSSVPARNMRKVSPKSDIAEMMVLGCTRLRTKGPRAIPSRIWITTSGTGRNRRLPSARSGATTAASVMRTSEGIALPIMRCRVAW